MELASLDEFSDFARFFSQVDAWPKNATERDEIAASILKLMKVVFVIVFFEGWESQGDAGVAVRFVEGSENKNFNRQGFVSYLKDQVKHMMGGSPPSVGDFVLKHVPISSGSIFLPLASAVQNLSSIGFREGLGKKKEGLAGITVGSSKALTQEQETTLLIIFEHLHKLGKVTELDANLYIRNQFLSIASHELKTPLTSIYGILQLQERMIRLRSDDRSFPEQDRHHHFLKMVITQVERLNELIDGLLDVSRIQNGRFTVEPTETDVATLLKESIQSRLTVIAHEAGVKLTVDSPPHLQAWVDPVRMEEVINNLVMNAIRFSPEGGVVWIRLRTEDGAFRLTVRDQGPSIAMEDRERIFQPFERAVRTSRMGGLGLGLYISRQIALLHGGNVSLVESVPGKGNVLEAYFPIQVTNSTPADGG